MYTQESLTMHAVVCMRYRWHVLSRNTYICKNRPFLFFLSPYRLTPIATN